MWWEGQAVAWVERAAPGMPHVADIDGGICRIIYARILPGHFDEISAPAMSSEVIGGRLDVTLDLRSGWTSV